MPRLPRPEDLERLVDAPPLAGIGHAWSRTRQHVLRTLLRRAAPAPDASPIDGGRGPHPLGEPDLPDFEAGPLADLGQAALAAGRGQATGLDGAIAWIAGDRPGQGSGWTRPGDVACRLIHLAAVHAWTRPNTDQAAAIGGSARAHAAWLLRERPIEDADPDVTLSLAAVWIAACSWPALPEARTWSGQALAGLRASAPAMVGHDGGPAAGSPTALARSLWGLALARAWARASGASLPADAVGALLQGSNALWRMQGDGHTLPLPDDTPAGLLPLGPESLAHTLRDLALAWGLDDGPRASSDDDPAVLRLAGRMAGDPPAPMAPDGAWQLWSWRGSGAAVAHATIKGGRIRVYFQAHGGRFEWSFDDRIVVQGRREPARLTVARRDDTKVRLIAIDPGADPFADDREQRDILAQKARVLITDRGVDRVEWTLGDGWDLARDDKGAWIGDIGDRTLVAKFDDDRWTWTVRGNRIEGHGPPDVAVRSIFELR